MSETKREGMDEATREALEGSIRKWELIVEGTGEDEGEDNCPLCRLFFDKPDKDDCEGCPVAIHTGEPNCRATPYRKWVNANYSGVPINSFENADIPYLTQLAQAELDFLKSLRPVQSAGEA